MAVGAGFAAGAGVGGMGGADGTTGAFVGLICANKDAISSAEADSCTSMVGATGAAGVGVLTIDGLATAVAAAG